MCLNVRNEPHVSIELLMIKCSYYIQLFLSMSTINFMVEFMGTLWGELMMLGDTTAEFARKEIFIQFRVKYDHG